VGAVAVGHEADSLIGAPGPDVETDSHLTSVPDGQRAFGVDCGDGLDEFVDSAARQIVSFEDELAG
jgi:hypothetical protein